MKTTEPGRGRILSLDQFRGYTVTGMIVVNYLGDFKLIHPVLKHHNTYFSYADSIMPSFHFAVGFALRLVLLKRLAAVGPRSAYGSIVRRCLWLILISSILELAGGDHQFPNWAALQSIGWWQIFAEPLKCQFWETLAIIGTTSLWVLPVIAGSLRARLLFMLVCAALHVIACHFFYFDFMWARPNLLDQWWGAEQTKGLDGGPLGFLMWAIPQIIGSIAYDIVQGSQVRSLTGIALSAALLMGLGYGLSCVAMLYRVPDSIATSPVIPPKLESYPHDWQSYLAAPPFEKPADGEKHINYWSMSKRTVGLSFITFSTGFALALYLLFFILSDIGGVEIGIFRTFGQNALAAYIIHEAIGKAVQYFAPGDSPLSWVVLSFSVYLLLTYLSVRYLERHGIFLRL